MTDMTDHESFTQRVRKSMYPNADEFPEWDSWDVFKDFIPTPRHPALSPTFTCAILMDLRPYREKVFTNLHENVCGLLGVENNFSTRQAVSPYTHIPNPLCEETLDSLKAKFKLTTLKDARC